MPRRSLICMQKKPIMLFSFYYNRLRICYIFVIIIFYDLHDGLLMVYQICIQYVRGELAQWKSTHPLIQRSQFDSGLGLILGLWIMMRHVSCILLLEWSTTSQRLWVYRISVPYAQKDPRFLFEKVRGQPWEFWSLVSTIDGSTLPQDCVKELICGT